MLSFEPTPKVGEERAMLVAFLQRQRAAMLFRLEGLDQSQAAQSMVPSGTSLLGTVKHLAWVERWWFSDFIGGQPQEYPWTEEDPDADFSVEETDSIESISQLYVDAIADSNAVIDAAADLEVVGTKGKTPKSLRWVLIHMIEETARHAGHADIVREMIDGVAGGEPLDD